MNVWVCELLTALSLCDSAITQNTIILDEVKFFLLGLNIWTATEIECHSVHHSTQNSIEHSMKDSVNDSI